MRAATAAVERRGEHRVRRGAGFGCPSSGGLGEGIAVMLSVVVFGLGVAALVARDELRAPIAPLEVTRHVQSSSSPGPTRPWSPARDVAR